ncbi:TfoX/Sxy family DNA transformation protein [[Pasteurella] aerogenes]|nr:DNA transformation protein TfoX [[Pasteurella] aerogenes]
MNMKVNTQKTRELRQQLEELVGNVKIKRLFIGCGIFKDEDLFGMCQGEIFYLKATGELAKYFESLGAVSYLITSQNSRLTISNYYRLPKYIMDDKKAFKHCLILSIEQAKKLRIAMELSKKRRIKELINLSIKHERLLAKIQVYDVETFKTVGAANCYVRLKKIGISVNISLYWSLAAALLNKYVTLLTAQEKKKLTAELNTALLNAGLKPVKTE